jgi:hypothetical protein
MAKTMKNRKAKNKTCKVTYIPASDKDIKAGNKLSFINK